MKTDPELMAAEQKQINQLVQNLDQLCTGYKETSSLLNRQLRAVIENDLAVLNECIDQQAESYENLKKSENDFKDRLVAMFQTYYPETEHPSLGRLIETIEEPTQQLEKLRKRLFKQVEKTEQLRQQLIDLLNFASDHNTKSISALSGVRNSSGQSYSANGEISAGKTPSLGLNQTV